MVLTGKQKRFLRALAHHVEPVVQVGQHGLSDAVVRQIDEALETHELIKIRLGKGCPEDRTEAAERIGVETRSAVVQTIGRVLVAFRARERDPSIRLPR